MKKFAVHPGTIQSLTDGQFHYISGHELARLYQLQEGEYIIWDAKNPNTWGRKRMDYHHLFPQISGNYGRPAEKADDNGL